MTILGAVTYTVTRAAEGDWTGGHYAPGAESTWTVKGSLQPADGRALELLPEGARSEARFVLLCDGRQTTLCVGDLVTVGRESETYMVKNVSDWTGHRPLPYRSYILGEVTRA